MNTPLLARLALLLLPVPVAEAQRAYRLSAPLERSPIGNVHDARVSGDGRRALYRADPLGDGELRLYRTALDASERVVDLGPTADGNAAYALDASGDHVVHLRLDTHTGHVELVGRRGDGSGPVLVLNAPLGPGGDVLDCLLAPAGDLVLYRADALEDGVPELFAVSTRGGRVIRVSRPAALGAEPDYVLGPDGRNVTFRERVAPGTSELFRGSVAGRTPRRLCSPHAVGGNVLEFALGADQVHVVYRADSRANDVFELFVAPADGSRAPLRLGPDLAVGGDVRSFELTPDLTRVVFRADAIVRGRVELFSAALDGSGFVRLNQDLASYADVLDFELTSDSAAVVFRANVDSIANQELFLVPTDGSLGARRLGPDLGPGQNVRAYHLRAGTVLYGVDPGTGWQPYVLALDVGAQPVALGPLSAFENVLIASATRFLFGTDAGLASVPIDLSSAPVPVDSPDAFLGEPIEPGELLLGLRSSTFGTASSEEASTSSLHVVPADGSRASLRISAPFPALAIVERVQHPVADPTGKHVAYTTRGTPNRVFLVESDGRSEPRQVGASAGFLAAAAFTHDGAKLVHVDQDGLYEHAADGSGARTNLVPEAVGFQLAPRASVVMVTTSAGGRTGLLALRLDGSLPVDLLAGLPAGVEFRGEAVLSPDGVWAAFSVAESAGGLSLYRVPTDGSLAPELASSIGQYSYGTVVPSPDGTALAFHEGSDLQRVALASGASAEFVYTFLQGAWSPEYAFDAAGHGLLIFDGGDLHLHLTGGGVRHLTAAHPGAAGYFKLDPSGARAVYVVRVDGSSAEFTYDLWSVALDGSSAAVRINTNPAGPTLLWPALRVITLAFSPDGSTAVFTGKGEQLVSAALDASRPNVVLATDPERFLWPLFPRFSPDSQTLVYATGGLFQVPASGGREPRRLDPPVPGSGLQNHDGFHFLGERRGLLFLAEPLGEGAHELFLGVLDRPVRGVPR